MLLLKLSPPPLYLPLMSIFRLSGEERVAASPLPFPLVSVLSLLSSLSENKDEGHGSAKAKKEREPGTP